MSPLTSTAARKQSQNANPRGTRSGLARRSCSAIGRLKPMIAKLPEAERPPDREERDQRGERPVRRQPDPARAQRPAQPRAAAVDRVGAGVPGAAVRWPQRPVEGAGHRVTSRPPSSPAAAARPRSGRAANRSGTPAASTYPVTAAADRLYQEQGVAVLPETAVAGASAEHPGTLREPVRVAQQDLLVLHVLQDEVGHRRRPGCPTAASSGRPASRSTSRPARRAG